MQSQLLQHCEHDRSATRDRPSSSSPPNSDEPAKSKRVGRVLHIARIKRYFQIYPHYASGSIVMSSLTSDEDEISLKSLTVIYRKTTQPQETTGNARKTILLTPIDACGVDKVDSAPVVANGRGAHHREPPHLTGSDNTFKAEPALLPTNSILARLGEQRQAIKVTSIETSRKASARNDITPAFGRRRRSTISAPAPLAQPRSNYPKHVVNNDHLMLGDTHIDGHTTDSLRDFVYPTSAQGKNPRSGTETLVLLGILTAVFWFLTVTLGLCSFEIFEIFFTPR